jgi:hypothetical protein
MQWMNCWWIHSTRLMYHWISIIQPLSSMNGAHLSRRSAGFIQIMTLTFWTWWRKGEAIKRKRAELLKKAVFSSFKVSWDQEYNKGTYWAMFDVRSSMMLGCRWKGVLDRFGALKRMMNRCVNSRRLHLPMTFYQASSNESEIAVDHVYTNE